MKPRPQLHYHRYQENHYLLLLLSLSLDYYHPSADANTLAPHAAAALAAAALLFSPELNVRIRERNNLVRVEWLRVRFRLATISLFLACFRHVRLIQSSMRGWLGWVVETIQ